MWRTWKGLQCDGIDLAYHFFDVGHSGDALNGQQLIAEDIGSKGYSYSIEKCVGVLRMQYRSDPSAIFVSGVLIRCRKNASFSLCGLIVEVVPTIDGRCPSLNNFDQHWLPTMHLDLPSDLVCFTSEPWTVRELFWLAFNVTQYLESAWAVISTNF